MVNYESNSHQNQKMLLEDILTKITYNLNFSFQLGFSVADFTSVARMNLAGIALRANTIMIITLIIVMTVVMFMIVMVR